MEIGKLVKNYETQNNNNYSKNEGNSLYGINEIMSMFPHLSKHIITNAINDGILPVTRIGNQRHFYLKDIEKFLELNTHRNVSNNSESWRGQ